MESTKNAVIIKNKKSDTLKIIALITMLIDHIGIVFFPQIITFRIIGRISFPIFAYQISVGYRYTKDFKIYIKRLFVFGLISQIPYMLALGVKGPNVMFTFVLALLLLDKLNKKEYLWIPVVLALAKVFSVSYGIYGILTVAVFYLLREHKAEQVIIITALNVLTIGVRVISKIQIYSLIGLFLILIQDSFPTIKIHKRVAYWFYPLHLIALSLLKILIL